MRQNAYVAPMVPIIRELGPGMQNTAIANIASGRYNYQQQGGARGGRGGVGGAGATSAGGSIQGGTGIDTWHMQQQERSGNLENEEYYFDRPHIRYDPMSEENIVPIAADLQSMDGTDYLVEGTRRGTMLDMAAKSEVREQVIAIFMLCSISLGVGVFVLPRILLTTGVATGIGMIIVFAFFAGYTQYISIDCAMYYKSHSYESLASTSLGKLGECLLAFFMAVSLFTGNCSHIATVGQLLHDIIDWFYTDQYEDYQFSREVRCFYLCLMLLLVCFFFVIFRVFILN